MPTPNELPSTIAPHHRERLARSGVTPAVLAARRYETADTKAAVEKLGFSRPQCNAPALVIPMYDAAGERAGVQIRPDRPRLNREGKAVKYESPRNSRAVIDVPPAARHRVLDPGQPLVITEGVIKADAAASKDVACVAVAGVCGWRADDPFWAAVPLRDRPVYVAFDSDQATNPNVRAAAVRLSNTLRQHGAVATVLCLPPGAGGAKQGLDDFLAAGRTAEHLFALSPLDVDAADALEPEEAGGHYRMTPHGLVREVVRGEEVASEPLTNFNAWITADVEIDNGSDVRHEFELTVDLKGARRVVQVPADEFERMTWVLPRLGGNAIVAAGFTTRDHARAAIQSVSGAIPRRKLYEHLGWVEIAGRWAYLHAGGAIGADVPAVHRSGDHEPGSCNSHTARGIGAAGPIGPGPQQATDLGGVGVRVPAALKDYALPDPISGEELRLAVCNVLHLFGRLFPPRLYLPLLGATFRIAADGVDFSVHLVGRTNAGKTVLLGLFAQFFGAGLHDRNLPGSWLSTSNSLLALMALAKNAILPIDDFVPAGSQSDIERANREADRVFRAQGNRAGRGRCTRDGTPKEGRSPQCLPVSTGEDVPEGHSLNSRLLALEVRPGDVLKPSNHRALSHLQKLARRGLFAQVMASFLAWLAPRYEEQRAALREQREEFREVFREDGRLARTVDIAADVLAGFDLFLAFCLEQGAVTGDTFDHLWEAVHGALHEVLDEQAQTAEEADPVSRYLDLLVTALLTGYAHLKDRSNKLPLSSPTLWGWRETTERAAGGGAGDEAEPEFKTGYVAQGAQIGWVDVHHVYLEVEASLVVVQKLARDSSLRPLPLTTRTLGKHLQARGLLRNATDGHTTTKITVVGIQKRVLQLEVVAFVELQGRAYTRDRRLDELLA